MKRLRNIIGGALALTAVAVGSTASAGDGGPAWGAWSDRAQAIDDALSAGDGARVNRVCHETTAALAGPPAAFPAWTQGLDRLCHVTDTIAKMQSTGDEKAAWCAELKDAADRLGMAQPVGGEPRAARIALELSAISHSVYDNNCRRPSR